MTSARRAFVAAARTGGDRLRRTWERSGMRGDLLVVPRHLHRRNARAIRDRGIEHTGATLIEHATRSLGLADLSDTDVLDVGCGVRFAQTIVNRRIAVRSYTGIDVDPRPIGFLRSALDDDRFAFAHWNVHHPIYNPKGSRRLTRDAPLPVPGSFDAIWMFSVVTHLAPHDTDSMLAILRGAIRPNGALLFSAFLDDEVAVFEEGDPRRPSLETYYNGGWLRGLLARNGWEVETFHPRGRYEYIADHFVCRPAPRAWS